MKKFFKEFFDFIRKGNILDLAIGIIIGGAFNTIVRSFVNDIIMPLIGLIGGTNVSEARIVLVDPVFNSDGSILKNAVTLNYGAFIQSMIDFLIIAFTIFITLRFLKRINNQLEKAKAKFIKNKETKDIVKPTTEELLTDIRDLLKEDRTKNRK